MTRHSRHAVYMHQASYHCVARQICCWVVGSVVELFSLQVVYMLTVVLRASSIHLMVHVDHWCTPAKGNRSAYNIIAKNNLLNMS